MRLASDQIRAALEATGRRLGDGPGIEVLVVGGAAALLNGFLRPERTTADVDVLNVDPSREDEALYEAAAFVGREMGLANDWLNGEAGLYREALPSTWKDRRVEVGALWKVEGICRRPA
jgi:hypothetical protein